MNTDLIVQTLKSAVPDLRAVYLFGSQAHGDAGAESDWDIAFLADKPLPDLERYELAQTLAARSNSDVDLVDLTTANAVMRMQAIGHGRCLYRVPAADVDAFEDFVFADYARLNEERAGILADVRTRGSVYGR